MDWPWTLAPQPSWLTMRPAHRGGVATEAMMNPQVPFGEDILSRISYIQTHDDGLARLNSAIVDGLNKLAARAARRANLSAADITEIVLVGNTVMHHIVLNISPIHIGTPLLPWQLTTP